METEFLALQTDDVPAARGEHNQSPRTARPSSPTGSFVSAANLFLSKNKRHSSGRTQRPASYGKVAYRRKASKTRSGQ